MGFIKELAGVPSSGGSGNATVPNNAVILPPQAFVDNIAAFNSGASSSDLLLSNKGITFLDGPFLGLWVNLVGSFIPPPNVDLSGNSITSTNAILAAIAATGAADGILNLSGGGTVAPSGQGITDKNTIIAAGWTVTTN